MSAWLLLGALAGAALAVILAVAALNALAFPRLGRRGGDAGRGRASVLVPARDEAPRIAATVRALLAQGDALLELLVLDDGSSDGTAAAARAAADGDPRLRVLDGAPLPAGWIGKSWACEQLGRAARGELLVFTDADVRWAPGALAALLRELDGAGADVATVWPTQETRTLGERLVVPLMALAVLGYLPAPLVHRTRHPALVAANGQCLAFRRAAYARVGGHAAVRADIVEDMGLAKRAKRAGLSVRMADGAGLVSCRMYGGWAEVRDGYAKNLLAGYGGAAGLALGTLFHLLVFLFPWVWLAAGAVVDVGPGWPLAPLALAAAGVLARALTAAATRQRVLDALLMPLSVLAMTRIALRSFAWHLGGGGPAWKGRRYPRGVRHPAGAAPRAAPGDAPLARRSP